jgi:hypothetical protein
MGGTGGFANVGWVLLSPLKGIRDKTNCSFYQAAAATASIVAGLQKSLAGLQNEGSGLQNEFVRLRW